MNKIKLSNFEWNPTDITAELPFEHKIDNMTSFEYDFIRSLIKFYNPINVLEIGVARGGGSCNILSVLAPEGKLVSIDILKEEFHVDGRTEPIGYLVYAQFPDIDIKRYHLITERDPFDVLDDANNNNQLFDFVVIDSAHFHPVETLNFLASLPHVKDGAIVILHDLTNYVYYPNETKPTQYASRLLFSCVVADKIVPSIPDRYGIPNIGAFQIIPDTRKYLRNLFELLLFPWHSICLPSNVANYIKKHYGESNFEIFNKAIEINEYIHLKLKIDLRNILAAFVNNLIFYGAGTNMTEILNIASDLPYVIWDINANDIKEIKGHKVVLPDFVSKPKYGQVLAVTIGDLCEYSKIKSQFEVLGYQVVHGIQGIQKLYSD
jgi:predicted O-methyltransferase YrrM